MVKRITLINKMNSFFVFYSAPVGLLCDSWSIQLVSAAGAVLLSDGILLCAFATNILTLYIFFGFVSGNNNNVVLH